jgi:maltose-binding protein MalE
VAVLDGIVQLTSQGQTFTLDARTPSQALVVIQDGRFGPPQPIPDRGLLLQDVSGGQDIQFEQPVPGGQIEPPVQDTLTLWADERLRPALEEIGAQFEKDTGTRLLIEAMPMSDIRDRYISAMQAGSAPDLVTSHTQHTAGHPGSVLPIGMSSAPSDGPGYQAFSYKGEVYGIPIFTTIWP